MRAVSHRSATGIGKHCGQKASQADIFVISLSQKVKTDKTNIKVVQYHTPFLLYITKLGKKGWLSYNVTYHTYKISYIYVVTCLHM